jgi:hypothetical protein
VGEKWASEASQGDTFTGGDSLYNGTNRLSSSTQPGAWLKIELPYKLRLQYMSLFSDPTTEQPEDFIIYGSNDDNTWDQLFQKTGATANTDYVNYTINSVSCYKYFALVVRRLISSTTIAAIDEWKLYGHRENDLVRLPDPTNVLKYPHVAMTGPAQRGYVVTASADNYNSAEFYTYSAFNNIQGNEGWHGGADNSTTVYHFSADPGGSIYDTSKGGSLGGNSGEWLKLELPHKIVVDYIILKRRTTNTTQVPKDFKILGSENDVDWDILQTVTGASTDLIQNHTIGAITGYKYLAILVTRVHATVAIDVVISELEYYGTGVDSIPIQIGGGNIDKVANFRVYDKFVGEDQALEIWDAQKDEFGRAKSSMTLHKGRLGIGTTEPEGRLAVADEPHNLEEFPPRGMTGYETYFEGHGEFCASSGTKNTNNGEAYLAFNKTLFERGWHGGSETDAYYTNSIYQGSLTNGGYSGDWIRLDLPYKVKLTGSTLYHRDGSQYVGRMPKKGVILGSNDNGKSWELVHSWDNETYEFFKEKRFVINSDSYFKSFILVTQELANNDTNSMVNLGEWRLFGTREQGQSVLHDGQLTLTKSLTVPRIGPALDADDTPRRDRLVVEYNTSTNPTFEGAVRDTSGRGLDGVFTTGAGYNANEKALTFNGATTSGITVGGATGVGGDKPFSIGLWFNMTSYTSGGANSLVTFGNPATHAQLLLTIDQSSGLIYGQFFGASVSIPISGGVQLGNWYHFVLSYPGGGHFNMSLYSNGVKGTNTEYGGNTTALIPENAAIEIGRYASSGNPGFNGKMSSFKFYDTALTAQEVKTLYDMGRLGNVIPKPLHVDTTLQVNGLFQGNSPLQFFVVNGQFPASGSTQTVTDLPQGLKDRIRQVVFIQGLTVEANGDNFTWIRHNSSTWEVDIKVIMNPPSILLSGFDATVNLTSKAWRIFVVTT